MAVGALRSSVVAAMFVPMGDQSKNEGLQAARAVAALSVAYFHSYIALRAFPETAQLPIGGLKDWGFLGVNFFFAISGYVICLVVSRPGFAPIPFAIRRVFRLYPMYSATMAVIVVLIALGKYRLEPIGHFLYSMTLPPQQSRRRSIQAGRSNAKWCSTRWPWGPCRSAASGRWRSCLRRSPAPAGILEIRGAFTWSPAFRQISWRVSSLSSPATSCDVSTLRCCRWPACPSWSIRARMNSRFRSRSRPA